MNFAEALAELGIDAAAGPDQARRAYLRLLKTRKPETDPQGFMRLRQAYELVKPHLEQRDAVRRFLEERAAAEEAARAAKGAPDAPGSDDGSPKADDRPPSADDGAPSADDRRSRADDLPPSADNGSPSADDRRSRADDLPPGADDLPPAADDGSPSAADDSPRADALPPTADDRRPRVDDLPPRSAEGSLPASVDEPSDEALPTEEDVDALVAADRDEEAAEALTRIFRAADLHAGTPPVHTALALLLRLHAADNGGDAAPDLYKAVRTWLTQSGEEARLLRGNDAVIWALVRELSALPPSFPVAMRDAIARAAVEGDLAQARTDLAALRRARPTAARQAAHELRASAPMLAAALADTLDPPPPRAAPAPVASGGGSWRGAWALVVVLMGIVRIFAATSSSSTPSYDPSRFQAPRTLTPPAASLYYPGERTPIADLEERAIHRAERVRAHADYQMADAGTKRHKALEEMAKDADDTIDAIKNQDCTRARAIAHDLALRATVDGGPVADDIGRVEVLTLDQAVGTYCKAVDRRGRTTDSP